MPLRSIGSLRQRLNDKKFRDAFVSSRIAQTLATQIRVLRQRENMSQADLAKALGTSQNAISRLESPKYGRPTITTLKAIASLFDVGLVVRFAPLSELARWPDIMTSSSLNVPPLKDDPGFIDRKPAQSTVGLSEMIAVGEQARGEMRGMAPKAPPNVQAEKLAWKVIPIRPPATYSAREVSFAVDQSLGLAQQIGSTEPYISHGESYGR